MGMLPSDGFGPAPWLVSFVLPCSFWWCLSATCCFSPELLVLRRFLFVERSSSRCRAYRFLLVMMVRCFTLRGPLFTFPVLLLFPLPCGVPDFLLLFHRDCPLYLFLGMPGAWICFHFVKSVRLACPSCLSSSCSSIDVPVVFRRLRLRPTRDLFFVAVFVFSVLQSCWDVCFARQVGAGCSFSSLLLIVHFCPYWLVRLLFSWRCWSFKFLRAYLCHRPYISNQWGSSPVCLQFLYWDGWRFHIVSDLRPIYFLVKLFCTFRVHCFSYRVKLIVFFKECGNIPLRIRFLDICHGGTVLRFLFVLLMFRYYSSWQFSIY